MTINICLKNFVNVNKSKTQQAGSGKSRFSFYGASFPTLNKEADPTKTSTAKTIKI